MTRKHYAIFFFMIIVLGLLSRKISFVPFFVGDMLYAMMMVALFRFVLIMKPLWMVCLWSLTLCFAIECSQLLTYDWLMQMRTTIPGRLILGQGFLWSDLIAYTAGTLSFGISIFYLEERSSNSML
tara:strand:- start:181 stop:558 length:378 start_codon:yes stop_codon:yes gene_type:complete